MLKKTLFLPLILSSFIASGAGSVSYLEVEEDVVLFSLTNGKTDSVHACAEAANQDLWSLSLSSDSGRAMYSLLLTSMADVENIALTVESAGDCAITTGIERASKVQLVSNLRSSVDGTSLIVYNWDGSERLGPLVEMASKTEWHFLDEVTGTTQEVTIRSQLRSFYFIESGCQGTVYAPSTGTYQFNPYYKHGQYHTQSGDVRVSTDYKSILSTTGECVEEEATESLRTLIETNETDPFCGLGNCILRKE